MCIVVGSILFLGRAVAQETCPTEVKVLLAMPTAQPAVLAFGFTDEAKGIVYFFDTDSLELLLQGIIIRIRQGSNNDLTVKLRLPDGSAAEKISQLRARFPCEADRTQTSVTESYSIGRPYRASKVPEIGADVYGLLSGSQKQLLEGARFAIDWTRVRRIATINSTRWKTGRRSPYGKLSLELWEWPAGNILEVSERISPAENAPNPTDLEALVRAKELPLSLDQDMKTTTVLKALTTYSRPLK